MMSLVVADNYSRKDSPKAEKWQKDALSKLQEALKNLSANEVQARIIVLRAASDVASALGFYGDSEVYALEAMSLNGDLPILSTELYGDELEDMAPLG